MVFYATGIICGLAASSLNYFLLYFSARMILKKQGQILSIWYLVTSLIRYVIFGSLVYIFLKFKIGHPLGLIIGITIVLIIYMIWGRKYVAYTGSNKV